MNLFLGLIPMFVLLAIAMLARSLVHTLLHHYALFDGKFNADDEWFNPYISWVNKNTIKWTIKIGKWTVTKFKIPVQFSDGFHFFNTVELGCYDAIISYLLVGHFGLGWYWFIIFFLIIGVLFMPAFFNLGYDKLWKK